MLRTSRGRTTRTLAALLLTLQGLAGGVVPLVHAREPETAPVAIEAHHTASCIVIHDAVRCALCRYAGSRVVLRSTNDAIVVSTMTHGEVRGPRPAALPRHPHFSTSPRAPPNLPA